MNCINPMQIPNNSPDYKVGRYYKVPCGKCAGCKKHKVSDWAIRMKEEEKVSTSSYFITLTYDDLHLPYKMIENVDEQTGEITCDYIQNTLCKKDIQDFMKRLRQYYYRKYKKRKKLVYFACGEYGKRFGRAHYHLILFNLPEEDLENAILMNWQKGFVKILPLEDGGIGYVTKYMAKESRATELKDKEFFLMSKGIGLSYLEKKHNGILSRLIILIIWILLKKERLRSLYREFIKNIYLMIQHVLNCPIISSLGYMKRNKDL